MTHVKGHQDANKKYEDIYMKAQMNVDANALTTQALDEGSVVPPPPFFRSQAVSYKKMIQQ